jgi:hypothetical protein
VASTACKQAVALKRALLASKQWHSSSGTQAVALKQWHSSTPLEFHEFSAAYKTTSIKRVR